MATITAADIPVVSRYFQELDTTLSTYVSGTSSDVVATITPAAQILGVLLITVYGILLMRGSIQAPIMDAAYRALVFVVLLGIALNVGLYQDSIAWFFMNAPGRMASIITDSGATPADTAGGNAITNFLVSAFNLGDRIWQDASWRDIGRKLLGVIVFAIGTLLGAYAAFLFTLSGIATAVLLAIGPIFILAAIFESTKRFVEMWLQQLFNFGLITILTAATLQFLVRRVSRIAELASSKDAPVGNVDILNFAVIAVIGILVLRQIMPLASGLAGGMALSTQGAFGAASQALARGMGTTAKRFTPSNMAERYRQNQRNGATLRLMAQDFKASPMRTLAQLHGGAIGGAAANAYKRKHQPGNSVSKAA